MPERYEYLNLLMRLKKLVIVMQMHKWRQFKKNDMTSNPGWQVILGKY